MVPPDELQSRLRALPAVGKILASAAMQDASERLPQSVLTHAARSVLDEARATILNGETVDIDVEALARRAAEIALRRDTPSLRAAINATGIVLHTGLGRARLAHAAQEAVRAVAASHSVLEIDDETGKRGSRQDHVSDLLQELTGAEAACVVNNCAGATLLAVSVLAFGREVIISRGELVEIGGAFRMPDIIAASGAKLVEVGTTNKTRLSDYANAIGENTGLILRCHPSNFALVGFTESVPTAELAQLRRERGVPVMDDQGSGAILDLSAYGVAGWGGTLGESVRAGCDVITASGDKLLGASQAGLILGKKEIIGRILTHPLARALRIDKLSLAALEATLKLYRIPEWAVAQIPTLRAIARSAAEMERRAQTLADDIAQVMPEGRFEIALISSQSQVGGGSLPGENLPTVCVAVSCRDGSLSPDALAAHLRRWTPAIFARIHHNAVLFDPRTLAGEEFRVIAEALCAIEKSALG